MKKIVKNVAVEIDLSPEEVAVLFCDMDEFEQAEFFNAIAIEVKKWDTPFEFQLASIFMNGELTQGGTKIMKLIGESVEPL